MRRGSGDTVFEAFEPECLVIAGSYQREINDMHKRASFELFRGNLRHVRVITFAELFRKIEVLLRLFETAGTGGAA